jgi:hypothetical protein
LKKRMKHKRKRGEDETERHAAAWCPALYATWQWIDLMAYDMDQRWGRVLNASSLSLGLERSEECKMAFPQFANCSFDLLCFQWWLPESW